MSDYPGTTTGPDTTITDCWTLVRAAQAGDRSAFGQLYAHYRPMVTRLVYSRTRDRPLTEDLVQETFLRALRRLATVHDQGRDYGAFLVTIARNLITDHFKSSRARFDHLAADVPEQPSCTDGPEQTVIDSDAAASLWALVDQLSPEQRSAVHLRFRRGLPVTEAAATAGCSDEALKARTHRGLVTLRRILTTSSDG
jgi:RNA polymerase sigma-70 factor (ECF subfamily)